MAVAAALQLLPDPPYRHTGGQQCRLGAGCRVERLGGPFLDHLPEIIAQRIGGFLESGAHHAVAFRQLAQHADLLGALPGKDEARG